MKNSKFLLSAITFLTFSLSKLYAGNTGINPDTLKLKVYRFAVSTSSLCTNMRVIIDNTLSPQWVDFTNTPSLGGGTLDDGTYPCVAIEFSDNIKFVPATNSTNLNCLSSVEYTMDVCRSGSSYTLPSTMVNDSRTAGSNNCTDSEGKVIMYLSTASANPDTSNDSFKPPTSQGDTKGFNLSTALTVSGSASAKFVVNSSGKICDGDSASCDGGGNSGQCRMEAPVFDFSQN